MKLSDLKGNYTVVKKANPAPLPNTPLGQKQPLKLSDLKGNFKVVKKADTTKNEGFLSNLMKTDKKVGDIAGNVGAGIDKGVVSTVQGLGQLTLGAMDALNTGINKVTGSKIPTADPNTSFFNDQKYLDANGISQNIGKFGEQIAEFFIPGSVEENAIEKGTSFLSKAGGALADESGELTKLGKTASAGVRAAVRGAAGGAVTAAQTGSAKAGAGAGALIAATNPFMELGAKFLGGILKGIPSFLSGKGSDIVNAVIKSPDAALKGMKDDSAESLRKSALAIKKIASDTYEEAKNNYAKGLQEIEDKYKSIANDFKVKKDTPVPERNIKGQFNYNASSKPTVGMTTITPQKGTNVFKDPQGNMFNLSLTSFKSKISQVFKDFGVDGSFTKGFDFSNAPTVDSERVLKNVYNKVKGFTNISPTGINDLIRSIETIGEKTRVPEAKGAITQITKNMRDYLGERIPEINVINQGYAKASQFLEDLDTHLSTGTKGGIKAGMRTEEGILETANKIAQVFNTNKELARNFIVNKIPHGAEILGEQAGRELGKGVSAATSLTKGGLMSRLIETVIPSNWVGWSTAQGTKLIRQAAPILEKLPPAEQAIMSELFRSFFSGNQPSSNQNQQRNLNQPAQQSFLDPLQN